MSSRNIDLVWRICRIGVGDVLMPLLVATPALFVSVGYILTHFVSVNIDVWVAILWLSIVVPLALLLKRARSIWQQARRDVEPFSWRALLPLISQLILLPPVFVLLARPSIKAIAHVDIYFVYAAQLFNGIAPPENIFLPGFPANHYWLFHAFIAAVVKSTTLDVYSAANIVNIMFIFGCLFWLARSLLVLELAKARSLSLGFMVIFAFGAINLTGVLAVAARLLNGQEAPYVLELMLLEGGYDRIHSVFPQIYHGSGMTPGFMALTVILYCCVRILKRGVEFQPLLLISAGVIITLAVMPIFAPSAAVLLGALALTAALLRAQKARPITSVVDSFRDAAGGVRPRLLAVWLLASAVLAAPLVKYVLELTYNSQGGSAFELFNAFNIKLTLTSQLVLLPFFVLLTAGAARFRRGELYFVQISGLLSLVYGLGLILPDHVQYKLQYVLSMHLAISTLVLLAIAKESDDSRTRRIGHVITVTLFALAFANAVIGIYGVIERAERKYGTAQYDGIHVQSTKPRKNIGHLPAFYFIRENTPADSIILVPYADTDIVNLFHERLNFVTSSDYFYARTIPTYEQRVSMLKLFYDPATPTDVYFSLLQAMQSQLPGRALYAVVKDSEVSPDVMRKRNALQVFEYPSDGARVYLLNPAVLQ